MIYADTSFWVALRMAIEKNHSAARSFLIENEDEDFIWSPWNRTETFNTIRQLALDKISEGDARQAVASLERDARLGYYVHREADWREVLRAANEISAQHAFAVSCRAADLLHVAYAQELVAEIFVSFDEDQIELAKAAGLNAVKPR